MTSYHSVGCFSTVSFLAVQKLFHFTQLHLSVLLIIFWVIGAFSTSLCWYLCSDVFSLNNYIQVFNPFQIDSFFYSDRSEPNFILLQVDVVFLAPFVKEAIIFIFIFGIFVENYVSLFLGPLLYFNFHKVFISH